MEEFELDIIMGVYNCEKYIDECINSLLKQTFKNWRLIMCDDGSKDNSASIAQKYVEKYPEKIVLLRNDMNMGLNYTLNKCLNYSTSKYIARQDADDTSEPTRFEKEINFLKNNPDYSFVSCNANLYDENGVWGCLNYKERPLKDDFLDTSPFCHAAVIIKRDPFVDVNGYTVDKKLLRVEDYHLWFKLYAKGYIGYNIQENLYNYRDDMDAVNRRTWNNRINEYYVRKIGYRMLKISLFKRVYMFKPIILGIIPKGIYVLLHRNKLIKK